MASDSPDGVDLTKLEESERYEWAIKDHAVVAIWHEEMLKGKHKVCDLGDRTPHNKETPGLHLWIGEDVDNGQLLIVLVMRIRLRASKKTAPRKMFLVVPSELLHIKCTTPTFGEILQHDVPSKLVDQPSDKVSKDSARILHIAFSLGRGSSSQVIMPKAQSKQQTFGQPLHLLQSLRSLSHAQEFSVYLNFNTYAQEGLNRLSTKLDNGMLTTPSIDLVSMYARNGGGSINNWYAQGLFEYDDMSWPAGKRKPSPTRASRAGTPDQPPPPYTTRGGQTIVPRSCTPVSLMPGSDTGSCVPETPLLPLDRAGKRRCTSSRSPNHDLPPCISAETPEASIFANAHLLAKACLPVDTSSVAQACLSIACSPVDHVTLPAANTTLLFDDPLSASNPHTDSTSRPADADPVNASPLTNDSHQLEPLSIRISSELSSWLMKAWTTCPNAHFIFIANLLRIGAAAHSQNETLYAQARAETTTNLLYYNPPKTNCDPDYNAGMNFLCRRGRRASAADRATALKHETTRMILWMNTLSPTADLFFMKECLARWAEKGLQLIEFDRDGDLEEYSTLLREFNHLKALCVVETCFWFGREELSDGVEARMRESI